MCGIAGVVDPITPPNEAVLARMEASLVKRGPDAVGQYCHGPLGLLHRRLSIIDLSEAGQQPLYNEDRSLAVIANGEIYDYIGIRNELIGKGHAFRSDSDSEVLLHLYEEYGPQMVERLNGMFAFCIANLQSNELFIARDRLGQKPLFYAHSGRRIAFASGPRALASLSWVDRTIDPQAIHDYLELQQIQSPASVYCGIRKLPPGCTLKWSNGTVTIGQYWTPALRADDGIVYEDAVSELKY